MWIFLRINPCERHTTLASCLHMHALLLLLHLEMTISASSECIPSSITNIPVYKVRTTLFSGLPMIRPTAHQNKRINVIHDNINDAKPVNAASFKAIKGSGLPTNRHFKMVLRCRWTHTDFFLNKSKTTHININGNTVNASNKL